jgi:hypothetical protein
MIQDEGELYTWQGKMEEVTTHWVKLEEGLVTTFAILWDQSSMTLCNNTDQTREGSHKTSCRDQKHCMWKGKPP